MTSINLRDFYYWYTQDEYIEVSDDVAEALRPASAMRRPMRSGPVTTRLSTPWTAMTASIFRLPARAHAGRGAGAQGAVLPFVERAEQPAGNPGPPGGRSLYPRHDLPGDCPGRGRGQERGAALCPERHRADEKISAKKSVDCRLHLSSTFLVVYERKFFLLPHN